MFDIWRTEQRNRRTFSTYSRIQWTDGSSSSNNLMECSRAGRDSRDAPADARLLIVLSARRERIVMRRAREKRRGASCCRKGEARPDARSRGYFRPFHSDEPRFARNRQSHYENKAAAPGALPLDFTLQVPRPAGIRRKTAAAAASKFCGEIRDAHNLTCRDESFRSLWRRRDDNLFKRHQSRAWCGG